MSQTKLGLSALAFELAAWAQLTLGGTSDLDLVVYFMSHGCASVLLAFFAYALLPPRFSRPRTGVVGLIFGLIFFLPVMGFLGVLVATVLLPILPRFAPRALFGTVNLPELAPHERTRPTTSNQIGVRGFLGNAQAPIGLRLRALVALQNLPGRVASPLLRSVLADPAEDLRLLAYGMLETLEKRLNARIHEELQRFNHARDDGLRLEAARHLAELYWELVYQDLVQGDLARHAIEQSLHYTRLVLAAHEDAALHLLHGRLLHLQGASSEARNAYQEALGQGIPATRVIPYLAQLAFEQRDYREVRRLMAALHDWRGLPRLLPVIRYWSGS